MTPLRHHLEFQRSEMRRLASAAAEWDFPYARGLIEDVDSGTSTIKKVYQRELYLDRQTGHVPNIFEGYGVPCPQGYYDLLHLKDRIVKLGSAFNHKSYVCGLQDRHTTLYDVLSDEEVNALVISERMSILRWSRSLPEVTQDVLSVVNFLERYPWIDAVAWGAYYDQDGTECALATRTGWYKVMPLERYEGHALWSYDLAISDNNFIIYWADERTCVGYTATTGRPTLESW